MAKITEFGVEASSYDEYLTKLRFRIADAFSIGREGQPSDSQAFAPELPLGQLTHALALELSELDEGVVGVYNNQSLEHAMGQGLINLASLSGLVKAQGETDASLRRRVRRQRAIAGTQSLPALQSALDRLGGSYVVLENPQASQQVVNGITMPRNSVYIGVGNSFDNLEIKPELVKAIGLHKPIGVAMATSGGIGRDRSGVYEGAYGSITVRYTVATIIFGTITLTATRNANYPPDGDARLTAYLRGLIHALQVGQTIDTASAVFGVYGLLGAVFAGIPVISLSYATVDGNAYTGAITAAHHVIQSKAGGVQLAITQ